MYKKNRVGIIARYILFIAIFLFAIFPIYWIISCSFRETSEIQRVSVSIIPKTFTMQHYIDAFQKIGLWRSLKNSLIVTVITIVITIPLGGLGAYAFSKVSFKGKNVMKSSLCITYLAIAYPMATILLIGYIQDVPDSLEEAALIDGCNRVQAMFKIVFPLAMPGIITSSIFVFISIWQEYFIATSFINQDKARTVSMAMQKFVTAHSTDWGGIMAASVVAAIPVVILFICSRKKLTDNLAGGVKG